MAVLALIKTCELEYDLKEHFLGDLVTNFVLGCVWFNDLTSYSISDEERKEREETLNNFLKSLSLFSPLLDAIHNAKCEEKNKHFIPYLIIEPSKKILSFSFGVSKLIIENSKVTIKGFAYGTEEIKKKW